jgi:hypothetical protein
MKRHIGTTGGKGNANKILVRKLGRSRHRQEDNIRMELRNRM